MIQKKICMLGPYAVGKTSLVRRYVESIYSDKYHTTVGVKIDKKVVAAKGQDLTLLLWDIEGAETQHELRKSYLRGASGYLLVADGTRPETLRQAVELQARAAENIGEVPFILLINKADLLDQWAIDEDETGALKERGWEMLTTSAKTGMGVEEAFQLLAGRMMEVSG